MLYDTVPDNFFSPLSSPGRTVYWECIKRLFAITSRQLSFGVERDVLVDDLDFYFEFDFAADIRDLSDMQQGEQPGSSSRDKANQMLRRLESCGWIYTAVQIIRTLKQIETAKTTEYQGYIFFCGQIGLFEKMLETGLKIEQESFVG